MAPGTDGNIISYDANGDPVAVATGGGTGLTSAGAGSPPTFATPAATTVPYSDWVVKTASDSGMTATSKDQLIINSASAFTLNLPASPSNGDTVVLSNAEAGTVTGRNSSNIDSSAEDGTLNSGASVRLVYAGSTIGWHSLWETIMPVLGTQVIKSIQRGSTSLATPEHLV